MPEIVNKNIITDSHIEAENVHVGDTIINVKEEKPEFSEINLEAYEDDDYVRPHFTGQLVRIIRSSTFKILVLTGFYGFDKAMFTKYLAVRLVEKELEEKGQALIAKECQIISDFYGITTAIKESEEDCIFIINNLRPKDVNHNLDELRKVITSHTKNIYVLVSTNLPFSAWKNTNQDYWFDIQSNGLFQKGVAVFKDDYIYKKTDLQNYARRELNKRKLTSYKTILLDTINKVINSEINTPEQINVLFDLFAKSPTNDAKIILTFIQKTKRKDALISQWFHALSDDKKLIVLGMSLLNSLYIDQFFAIMEKLMLDKWHFFDDSAKALDMEDLEPLMHFFYFTFDRDPILHSKFPGQRFITLQTVWQNYQRRINAVLPHLIDLVINSIGTVSNWELYGSKEKRVRLREVVADIISEIGRLSPQSVEHSLLSLAANDNEGVQIVAAKAMARWREFYEDKANKKQKNNEKALFNLLHQWHEDNRYSLMLESLLQIMFGEGSEGQNSPSSYIRSTIVLTLGYASVYDEPNKLKSDIIDLLKDLTKDRNRMVVNRLGRTLRILLRNHPKQIGDQLFDLDTGIQPILSKGANVESYVDKIALGLVDAHKDYPMMVEQTIEEWYNYCDGQRPSNTHFEQFNYREKILSVVIIVLGLLDHDLAKLYDLKNAVSTLEYLRKVEHSEQVRMLLLQMILTVCERYNEEQELLSGKTIPNMTSEERVQAVRDFRKKYLIQRKELKGGDYRVVIDSYWIESWVDKEDRPVTEVEEMIKNWMDSKNETIVNIAIQSLMEFVKIEAKEDETVQGFLKEEEEKSKEKFKKVTKQDYSDKIKRSLLDRIMVRDKTAQLVVALAKQDGEMEHAEIKLLAKRLESYKKHKAAKELQGIYVQFTTKK